MGHIALYREWRPRTFDEIVEQSHTVGALKQAVISGKIAHAYLFSGTRGTGKTTMAQVFSRAINCLSPNDGNPCNKCSVCLGILNGSILDVIEMDAASNNSVDTIRRLCDEIIFTPSITKYKVYIIDEVHMLSTGAFNALLKTLEEPPSHAVFILATTEQHRIPATILSRCQRYEFRRIPIASIVERLRKIADSDGVIVNDDALKTIAQLADGALRDAISLLDQAKGSFQRTIEKEDILSLVGVVNDDFMNKMAFAIANNTPAPAMQLVEEFILDGRDVIRFTMDLAAYFRNVMICHVTKNPQDLVYAPDKTIAGMQEIASIMSLDSVLELIRDLSALVSDLRWSLNTRITFEIAIIRFMNISQSNSVLEPRQKPAQTTEPKIASPIGTPIVSPIGFPTTTPINVLNNQPLKPLQESVVSPISSPIASPVFDTVASPIDIDSPSISRPVLTPATSSLHAESNLQIEEVDQSKSDVSIATISENVTADSKSAKTTLEPAPEDFETNIIRNASDSVGSDDIIPMSDDTQATVTNQSVETESHNHITSSFSDEEAYDFLSLSREDGNYIGFPAEEFLADVDSSNTCSADNELAEDKEISRDIKITNDAVKIDNINGEKDIYNTVNAKINDNTNANDNSNINPRAITNVDVDASTSANTNLSDETSNMSISPAPIISPLINIDTVWSKILDEIISAGQMTVYLFLLPAKPVLEGNTVSILFEDKDRMNFDELSTEHNHKIISQAVFSATGYSYEIILGLSSQQVDRTKSDIKLAGDTVALPKSSDLSDTNNNLTNIESLKNSAQELGITFFMED